MSSVESTDTTWSELRVTSRMRRPVTKIATGMETSGVAGSETPRSSGSY
jgi:hypothetical protein